METNYKSDFDFLLRLYDCRGLELGWPDYDWECRFWTTQKANAFVASCRGGECRNCYNDGGVIHVVCDNHRLGAGVLEAEFTALLPDARYGDGDKRVTVPARTKIELVRGAACPVTLDVELTLPLLKGDKGDKGEQGEVSAAQLEEVHSELRREIVGLWDETAAIQAKLADLYSTECANLLRRLGYEQEDIDEFIWATAHLNLPIGMDDIRYSVNVWENKFEGDYAAKVAPKWTQELEDSEWTPATLIEKYFRLAVYYPHLTTAKGWWNARSSARYYAGMHALAEVDIIVRLVVEYRDCYTGLGSFTGKIFSFHIENGAPCLRYLRCLKSDIPIDLSLAVFNTYYLTDLSGICLDNASNMYQFACSKALRGEQQVFYNIPTKLPEKFLPDSKGVSMYQAFGGRAFSGEVFDLRGRIWDKFAYIFTGYFNMPLHPCRYNSCLFDNCEIILDPQDQYKFSLTYLGYMDVPKNTKSRISLHGSKKLDPSVLVSYQFEEPTECGVWEVDCPDVEMISDKFCATRTCCTFWNLGSSLKYNVPLKYMMRSYQGGFFAGGMYNNPVLRESFRASLRTWKEPPFAAHIFLYSEQYEALTEEDVADITEKGYTLVVSDDKAQYRGVFNGL